MAPVRVYEAEDLLPGVGANDVASCELEDGVLHLIPSGGDPYWTPFGNIVGARYVVVRYKTSDAVGADVQIYIGSNGTAPTDDSSTLKQPALADGEWHLAIFDTQSLIDAGIYDGEHVSFFRFDPLEAAYMLDENGEPYKDAAGIWARYSLPEGCSIYIDYLAFFHSVEAAEKYDYDRNKAPMWDVDKSVVLSQNFDQLYKGTDTADNAVNQGLNIFYSPTNPDWDKVATLDDFSVEALTYWGWLTVKDATVGTFGYQIVGQAPVFDESFTHVAEKPVQDAAASKGGTGTRMKIAISLAGLEGTNTVAVLYKDPAGNVVCLNEITVVLPVRIKDITEGFVADIASQEVNAALNATDLDPFFTVELPVQGVPGWPNSQVEENESGKYYVLTGISDMYANVNGLYHITANVLTSDNSSWMFVRGYGVVNSDEVNEKVNPTDGIYRICNFYENDGANMMGGAGIYARVQDGTLYVMVKYYNPEAITRVGNKIFAVPAEGTKLTMADDGSVVSILVDGKTMATVAMNGSVTYGDINEVMPRNGFAATAVVTLADGTTETIENTLIADTYECQVGLVARAGTFRFDSLTVGAYSSVTVPDMEEVEPPLYPLWDADKAVVSHVNVDFFDVEGNRFDLNTTSIALTQPVSTLWLRGWIATPVAEIGTMGYQIDDGEPVWSADFASESEQGVKDVAASIGAVGSSRMDIRMPLTDLVGKHTIYFLYRDTAETVVALRILTVDIAEAPEVEPEPENPVVPDYVTDGLTALYNGSSVGKNFWHDLIGENDLPVTVNDNNYFTESGLRITGVDGTAHFFPQSIVDVAKSNEFTVEIKLGAFVSVGSAYNTIMNSANDNFALFRNCSNDQFVFKNNPNTRPTVVGNTVDLINESVITLSFKVGDKCIMYVNGVQVAEAACTGAMDLNNLFIGQPDPVKRYDTTYESIRFYNRALTAEEVLHNAIVDGKAEAPKPEEPEVEMLPEFSLSLVQANLGKTLYFTGAMDGYYLALSEKPADAVKLYSEKVESGYRMYFLDGETKTYVEMYDRGNNKAGVQLVTEPTMAYTWNADANTWTATFGENTFYLGTYNTYTTISASNISYITGDNAANVGVSQFLAMWGDMPEIPVLPEVLHVVNDELRYWDAAGNQIGQAYTPGQYDSWDNTITVNKGEVANFIDWGWVAMSATESYEFGYIINGAEIFSPLWAVEAEPGVLAAAPAGSTAVSRFLGTLSEAALAVGENHVQFVVKMNGTEIAVLREYTVTIVDPNAEPEEPAGNELDVDSFDRTSNNSYLERVNADGWTAMHTAVSNEYEPTAGAYALILNGKTDTIGELTSPTLEGGISKLSFKVAYVFNESNAISLKITIVAEDGTTVVTDAVIESPVKNTAYDFEFVPETPIVGNFTIRIENNCPTASADKNKDRAAIWALTWESAEAGEEPDDPTPVVGTINVTTTDTYCWVDAYTFTAEEAGTYTFTVPAGLGLYTQEAFDAWDEPIIDYMNNDEGYTFSKSMTAGEEFKYIVGSEDKADWTITYTFVAGEAGGEEPDGPEGPDEPVVEDKVLVVGANSITVTDADITEGGMEYTFTAEAEGQYTFRSNDLLVRIYDASGNPVGTGTAYLMPGTYKVAVVTAYLWDAGTYTVTVVYEDPNASVDPEPETPPTEEGEPDGTSANPYVIESLPYEITVEGEHNLFYVFNATEDCVLYVYYPEGNYVSELGDFEKDEENPVYTVRVTAGQTLRINPWGENAGTYRIELAA